MTIRIGTCNILGRNHYRQGRSARADLITAAITEHSIDVRCLQEVHFYGGRPERQGGPGPGGGRAGQPRRRAAVPSHLDSRASLGLVIASRHPLSGRWTRQLENPRITANVRGKRWTLHDKGLLGTAVTSPLVLAGDFNHQSRASAAARWSRNDWTFCFDHDATTENGLSLDDIAFNRPARISHRGLSPTFSDHRLAVVELPLSDVTVDQQATPSMA